jgi:SAM-dependent methyltransferase
MKSTNLTIENFLNREGIKFFTNPELFWSWAQKRTGNSTIKQYQDFLEQRSTGYELGKKNFYDFIGTHNLSIVANSFEYELIQNILLWTESKLPQKGIILELGCHSGLLSRFYALIRPDAQVIGIDISKRAITTAREIADQKGINNLTYYQADVLEDMELSLPPVDCIISGRILSELMTAQFRYQTSWDQIAYAPIDEQLDIDAKRALIFCAKKISPSGSLLITERLSNYDRFNRAWLLTQKAGFILEKSSIAPICWTDVAGRHKTWFFEAKKVIDGNPSYKTLSLDEIPLLSKSTEVVNDESRLLLNGYLAYQTWLALDHSKKPQKVRLNLPGGVEEVIEQGKTGSELGYVFIGNTLGNYLLTLFLNFETESVKNDIEEYINQLLKDGAKIRSE